MTTQINHAVHYSTLYALQAGPVGKVLEFDLASGAERVLVDNMTSHPDGIQVDRLHDRMFWTNMGEGSHGTGGAEHLDYDGTLEVSKLDGSDRRTLIGKGVFVTGKQLVREGGYLYWCDREGTRVFRAKEDGTGIEVLVQNGVFPKDSQAYALQCVGIAVDSKAGLLYWTQKGAPKSGTGRIFRAGLEIPANETPAMRSDIEVIADHLPEPIDLELDGNGKLYWTDRGDERVGGNSLNRADLTEGKLRNHEIIASGFKEAIALAADFNQGHIYVSDLSGKLYRHTLNNPGSLEVFAEGYGTLTGIALA